jgi:hypothetical protein
MKLLHRYADSPGHLGMLCHICTGRSRNRNNHRRFQQKQLYALRYC